jgi:hypothetical protein
LENRVEKSLKLDFLGKIVYDEKVEEHVLFGNSLLDLSSDSLAYVSVKKVMEKAGYAK